MLATLLPAAVLLAGCSGGGGGSSNAADVNPSQVPAHGTEIVAKQLPPYGSVLTTASGYALYIFAPDRAQRVTCTGDCLKIWPAIHPTGSLPTIAGDGVKQSLLGTARDSNGKPVVTYNGWPLYLYAPDPAPGYATGQALDSDGGTWYLISADGHVIRS